MILQGKRCYPVKEWFKGHITGIRDREGHEIHEGDFLDSEWPMGQYIIVWEPRDAAFKAYESVDMLHCDTTIGMGTGQWVDAIIIKK